MTNRDERLRALEGRMADLAEEIAYLRALPPEPEIGAVVSFSRSWPGGRQAMYDYAAIRATNGKWYLTGGRSVQGGTWEEILALAGPNPVQIVETWRAV